MEILVVVAVALVVFGPDRLPEMARNLGKTISQLRETAGDLRSEFETGFDIEGDDDDDGEIPKDDEDEAHDFDDEESPRADEVRAGSAETMPEVKSASHATTEPEEAEPIPDIDPVSTTTGLADTETITEIENRSGSDDGTDRSPKEK
jgi:Tat protein translocase TatB subunit